MMNAFYTQGTICIAPGYCCAIFENSTSRYPGCQKYAETKPELIELGGGFNAFEKYS